MSTDGKRGPTFAVTNLAEAAAMAHEAPTMTPVGNMNDLLEQTGGAQHPPAPPLGHHPSEMKTSDLLQLAASLIEPFAWGAPVARTLRIRAERMKLGRAAEAMALYVDPLPLPSVKP